MTHAFQPRSDSQACGECGRPRISTAHDFDRKPAPETAQERQARRQSPEPRLTETARGTFPLAAALEDSRTGEHSVCTKCGFVGLTLAPHRLHPGCNYSAAEVGATEKALRAELERWKDRAQVEADAKGALMHERDEWKEREATLRAGIRLDGEFEVAFLDAYLDHFRTLTARAARAEKALAVAQEERRAADAHWSKELEKDHVKLAQAKARVAELEGSVRSLVASIAKMMAALEDELGPLIRKCDRDKLRAWTVEAAALKAMLQEPTP